MLLEAICLKCINDTLTLIEKSDFKCTEIFLNFKTNSLNQRTSFQSLQELKKYYKLNYIPKPTVLQGDLIKLIELNLVTSDNRTYNVKLNNPLKIVGVNKSDNDLLFLYAYMTQYDTEYQNISKLKTSDTITTTGYNIPPHLTRLLTRILSKFNTNFM